MRLSELRYGPVRTLNDHVRALEQTKDKINEMVKRAVIAETVVDGKPVVTGGDATIDPSSHNHDDRYYEKAVADLRYAMAGHTHSEYAPVSHTHPELAPATHNHNTLYYTKAQSLSTFAPAVHNHDDLYYRETEADARFAALVHTHDDRYFTEAEADARFAALVHTHDAAAIVSGNLGYARMPTGAGTWDAGNTHKLSHNAASYGWNLAGTERNRFTADGVSIGHDVAAFDPLATLHLKRLTGTATGGINPVGIRLHSSQNTNDHSTTLPWGFVEWISDDAGGLGAGSVRGRIGMVSNNTAGSEQRLDVWISSTTQLFRCLSFDPGNGANFFIAPTGTLNAMSYGRVEEVVGNTARIGGTVNAITAVDVFADILFNLTDGVANPLQGDMTFRVNVGDSLLIRMKLTKNGLQLLNLTSAPPTPAGGAALYSLGGSMWTKNTSGFAHEI